MAEAAQAGAQAGEGAGQAGADAAAAAAKAAKGLFGEGDPAKGDAQSTVAPEWANPKLWHGDGSDYAQRVTTAYAELEKAFHAKAGGDAADPHVEDLAQYKALFADTDKLAADYPKLTPEARGLDEMLAAVKSAGVGPKKAAEIARALLKQRNEAAPEPETDEARLSRVIHEMGPQGASRAKDVATWIQAQARSGRLSAAEVKAMTPLAQSASGMSALFKLIRGGGGPPDTSVAGVDGAGAKAAMAEERAKRVEDLERRLVDGEVLRDPAQLERLERDWRALTQNGRTRLNGEPIGAMRAGRGAG